MNVSRKLERPHNLPDKEVSDVELSEEPEIDQAAGHKRQKSKTAETGMADPEVNTNMNIQSAKHNEIKTNNAMVAGNIETIGGLNRPQGNLTPGSDGRLIQQLNNQHMVTQGIGSNPNQQNLTPEQSQQIARQVLQNQRFLNPTGQARFTSAQNPTLQMINQNASAGTYQNTQQCWGQFCGFISTYICFCCCNPPYGTVPQGFSGIIQRFGKFYKLVPPGMHYLNPELDQLVLVDKREQVYNLKKQILQTKDNVTITVDAVLYYKILDSYKSKFAVRDLIGALVDLTVTTVRNVVGRMTLQDVLEKREELSQSLMQQMTEPAFNWGAAVTRTLIQEIFFAQDQQSNMSRGAVGKKIAEAFVIQSQADVEAARLMKDAAAILNTEAAMQIRYVESLEAIAKTQNLKFVIFPADYNEFGKDQTDDF